MFISLFLGYSSIAEDTSNQLRFERKAESKNSVNQIRTDAFRRGSAGPVGTMMLLKSHQPLHAPFTQVTVRLGLVCLLSLFLTPSNFLGYDRIHLL